MPKAGSPDQMQPTSLHEAAQGDAKNMRARRFSKRHLSSESPSVRIVARFAVAPAWPPSSRWFSLLPSRHRKVRLNRVIIGAADLAIVEVNPVSGAAAQAGSGAGGPDGSGPVNEPLSLGVSVNSPAPSVTVAIGGMSAGARLTVGRRMSTSEWRVPAQEDSDASIVPPADFVGVMNLTAELRGADGAALVSSLRPADRMSATPVGTVEVSASAAAAASGPPPRQRQHSNSPWHPRIA